MFYGQCNDCNERWELGTASTCKCPDEALASEAKKPDFWEGYVPEPVKPRGEATLAQQEPVAWTPIDQPYPPGGELDILMGDGSILCEVLPQSDGDLWWGGASTGERFIDPKYASVTHWRIHAEHTFPPTLSLAQRSEASTWVHATTWRGLTDEELSEVYNQADWDTVNGWEYERAIEAKLKEKNT